MAFPSVYEMMNPLTTVRKQHFWEYFSGATLNSRWTVLNAGTTTNSTGVMADEIDGGYLITTSATNNDRIELDFNQKRQFSNTGCRFIAVLKIGGATTWNMLQVGFMDDNWGSEANVAMWGRDTAISSSKFLLSTERTGSPTNTSSTLDADASYHTFDATLTASNFVGTIDGTLTTTISTNLPDTKMQPHIARIAKDAHQVTMNIRYFEAYNT